MKKVPHIYTLTSMISWFVSFSATNISEQLPRTCDENKGLMLIFVVPNAWYYSLDFSQAEQTSLHLAGPRLAVQVIQCNLPRRTEQTEIVDMSYHI